MSESISMSSSSLLSFVDLYPCSLGLVSEFISAVCEAGMARSSGMSVSDEDRFEDLSDSRSELTGFGSVTSLSMSSMS